MGSSNFLLESLPAHDFKLLLSVAELITLPVKTTLFAAGVRPDNAYFLTDGVASLFLHKDSERLAQVGLIGKEGLIGSLHLYGHLPIPLDCFMRTAGVGWRVPLYELKKVFHASADLHTKVLEYNQFLTIESCQHTACNAMHSVEQRLARWLLLMQMRLSGQTLPITHEFLAEMVGVRRPTLSLAAAALQRRQVISYRHGEITIIDQHGLQSLACDCYLTQRDELVELYRPAITSIAS